MNNFVFIYTLHIGMSSLDVDRCLQSLKVVIFILYFIPNLFNGRFIEIYHQHFNLRAFTVQTPGDLYSCIIFLPSLSE